MIQQKDGRKIGTGDENLHFDRFPRRNFLTGVFLFALVGRLLIAGAYLNSYDTEWNIMWSFDLVNLSRQGGAGFFSAFSHVTDLDYPPLYLYPLYMVGRFLMHPSIGGYPPLRMVAIKFFPCLTDSLTCLILYRLDARRSKAIGVFVAGLWAINPATLFNCACWGQTDCVMICLAGLLMLAMREKRTAATGVIFAALVSTKLQGLYLAPVVGMEMLSVCFGDLNIRRFRRQSISRGNIRRFLGFAAAGAVTFAVIYLPFMIGGAMSHDPSHSGFWENFLRPVTVYSGGLAKYPYITMNADNLYMLLRLNGVDDSLQFLPGLSVGALGRCFLLLSMGLVVAVYLLGRRHSQWLAAYLFMECVFMLTCRQHERYQILTLLLLLGAFMEIGDKRLLSLFSLQSVVIFINQFRVLNGVREKSGWWHYYLRQMIGAEDMQSAVMQDGSAWLSLQWRIGPWNAFFNLCLFAVSMLLVLRYYFAAQYHAPLFSVQTWLKAARRTRES